jgi:uncharacterized protein YbjQ (UPF0145 family)
MPDIIIAVTTPTIAGYRVVRTLGMVTANAVHGSWFARDFLGSIRDVVGGRSGAYGKTLDEAMGAAYALLVQRAADVGANAVVGAHPMPAMLFSDRDKLMGVILVGTAVIVEPESP